MRPPIDVDGLKEDIASASPEQRIQLLEMLQSSAGIQELVKAGLLKWEDLMKENPPAGEPGHVSNPDGGKPPDMIIDAEGLDKLQTALEAFMQRKQINEATERASYAQQVTRPGPRRSVGGFLPGKSGRQEPLDGTVPRPGAAARSAQRGMDRRGAHQDQLAQAVAKERNMRRDSSAKERHPEEQCLRRLRTSPRNELRGWCQTHRHTALGSRYVGRRPGPAAAARLARHQAVRGRDRPAALC